MYTKQWTVSNFIKYNPEYGYLLPIRKCFNDKRYVVRTLHDNKKRIVGLEIGFENDNWQIPKPKCKNNPYKPYRRK